MAARLVRTGSPCQAKTETFHIGPHLPSFFVKTSRFAILGFLGENDRMSAIMPKGLGRRAVKPK